MKVSKRTICVVAIALAFAGFSIIVTHRHQHKDAGVTAQPLSSSAAQPGTNTHRIYRHSVVPGGVWTAPGEGFRAEFTTKPLWAYVSYKAHDQLYWTAKKISIPAGELIWAGPNGVRIRARCGNSISARLMAPTEASILPNELDQVEVPEFGIPAPAPPATATAPPPAPVPPPPTGGTQPPIAPYVPIIIGPPVVIPPSSTPAGPPTQVPEEPSKLEAAIVSAVLALALALITIRRQRSFHHGLPSGGIADSPRKQTEVAVRGKTTWLKRWTRRGDLNR